jgi:integrase
MGADLLDRNPVERVRPTRVAQGLPRRALTPGEFRRLMASLLALNLPDAFERATCYFLAVTTGLRRGELEALRVRHLNLAEPSLTLEGRSTKNRQTVHVPLLAEVAAYLAVLLGQDLPEPRPLRPEAKVFQAIPEKRTLYKDLDRAGIAKVTADGKLDFHAFRHTFCTWARQAAIDARLRQSLARHSDPRLTQRYDHVVSPERRAAIDRLGAFLAGTLLTS